MRRAVVRTARVRFGSRVALALAVTTATVAVEPARAQPRPRARTVMLSVVGTNDLHGHVEALPVFAGYLANLRRARRAGGGVVLVDGGDMFQGTLESNLGEGSPVVRAYNALGYTAAAIGNHEFDYGPVGEAATPQAASDDPRGALRARAREARFPVLAANLLDGATGRPVDWDNVHPSTLARVGGVRVGVIGVTTAETLTTTIAANVRGLRIAPLADTIRAEAERLRARGAGVVIVAAHAGGVCHRFDAPADLSSCAPNEEIFAVARALPPGLVDVIVAGHTHARVAHVVNGIAIIESHATGIAFGRVDLTVDRQTGRVVTAEVRPPRDMCARPEGTCEPGVYEGAPVVPDAAMQRLLAPAFERARELRDAPLGVRAQARIQRSYGVESALGNLFADLMRTARPEASVAMTNGGGLRADLPEGELTYGALFEAMPFDNHFALVNMRGDELARVVARNLSSDSGILSLSGVRATATCEGRRVVVQLARDDGRPVRADEQLVVATSDFIATGGDSGFASLARRPGAITVDEAGPTIRDGMANVLRQRRGTLTPTETFDPRQRRIVYPGRRPLRCGPPNPAPSPPPSPPPATPTVSPPSPPPS